MKVILFVCMCVFTPVHIYIRLLGGSGPLWGPEEAILLPGIGHQCSYKLPCMFAWNQTKVLYKSNEDSQP